MQPLNFSSFQFSHVHFNFRVHFVYQFKMQSYLSTPKFIKNFCYKESNFTYQHFCNTFAYKQIVLTKNPDYNCEILFYEANSEWKKYKKNKNIEKIIKRFFNTSVPI